MSRKLQHKFPEDWKNISQEEAIKHIKYLLEHYKEYDMRKFGDDGIVINEITFYPSRINLRHGVAFKYMHVNFQKIYSDSDDIYKLYSDSDDIYKLIQRLINVCKVEIDKREVEKAINAEKKAKKEKIKSVILIVISSAFIIATIAGTVYMVKDIFKTIDKERARQNKIENAVRSYEKTLPNYEEYKQTQLKIANYRDSLERVIR